LEGKSVQVFKSQNKFRLILKCGFLECYFSEPGKNLSAFGGTYRLHLQGTRLNFMGIHDQIQVQIKTTRICSGRIEEKGTERGNGQINQGKWRLKFAIQKE
jgi:hypothetical protein